LSESYRSAAKPVFPFAGHPTCMKFSDELTAKVRTLRWQCTECKSCNVCGSKGNAVSQVVLKCAAEGGERDSSSAFADLKCVVPRIGRGFQFKLPVWCLHDLFSLARRFRPVLALNISLCCYCHCSG